MSEAKGDGTDEGLPIPAFLRKQDPGQAGRLVAAMGTDDGLIDVSGIQVVIEKLRDMRGVDGVVAYPTATVVSGMVQYVRILERRLLALEKRFPPEPVTHEAARPRGPRQSAGRFIGQTPGPDVTLTARDFEVVQCLLHRIPITAAKAGMSEERWEMLMRLLGGGDRAYLPIVE